MVNLADRQRVAELIRGLISGAVTNRQFELDYPIASPDLGVREICTELWLYYDDFTEHSLVELYSSNPAARALLDRCILFLGTDLEYGWPPRIRFPSRRLRLLRMLRMAKSAERLEALELKRRNAVGDWDVWPFASTNSFLAAAGQRKASERNE